MSGFAPLPQPLTDGGKPRRVGVEIELGGVSEAEVARLCAGALGGAAEQKDSHVWAVRGTEIGCNDPARRRDCVYRLGIKLMFREVAE